MILGHRLRGLAMEHRAAITQCPTFTPGTLLADETIFHVQAVVGKFVFVKQVTILFIKVGVLVVRNDQLAIDYTKRIIVIFA